MNQEKIKEAASKLTVAKFILWAEDMELDPIITNRDEVFNVNLDEVHLDVGKISLIFINGKLSP